MRFAVLLLAALPAGAQVRAPVPTLAGRSPAVPGFMGVIGTHGLAAPAPSLALQSPLGAPPALGALAPRLRAAPPAAIRAARPASPTRQARSLTASIRSFTQRKAPRRSAGSAALRRVFSSFLDGLPGVDPESATMVGLHSGNSRLTSYDKKSRVRRRAFYRRHLKALEAVPEGSLAPEEAVDRVLLLDQLRDGADDAMQEDAVPSTFLTDPLQVISLHLLKDFAPARERALSALSRFEEYPKVMRQGRKLVKNPPKIFVRTAIEDHPGAVAFAAELETELKRLLPGQSARVEKAGRAARRELERSLAFLSRLEKTARGEWAYGRESVSAALAASRVAESIPSLKRSASSLAAETLREMRSLAAEIRPGMSWQKAVDSVGEDHPGIDGVIPAYKASIARARRFVVEKNLMSLPDRDPLEVVATPEYLHNLLPFAAYEAPLPLDETETGHVFVTLPRKGTPDDEAEAWLRVNGNRHNIDMVGVHEAIPGHHIQLTRQKHGGSRIRRTFWDVAFGEGWATYAEGVMAEAGFFEPEGRLLVLYERYWQAVRARVALALHADGWSLERAAKYLKRKLSIPADEAASSARRYAMISPVESIAYALGRVWIIELRERTRARLGGRFSLPEFHRRVLSYGGIPVPLIEAALERDWNQGLVKQ